MSTRGYCGLITMQSWMFLTSFEKLRRNILEKQIVSMLHLGPRAFSEIGGEVVNTTTFILSNKILPEYLAIYKRLVDYKNQEEKEEAFLYGNNSFYANEMKFYKIPNAQVAYWVNDKLISLFEEDNIGKYAISDGQTKTGNNDIYLRNIWEINTLQVGKGNKWVPHAKGGTFRRWYGNVDTVIDWSEQARNHYRNDRVARIAPEYIWFREGVCWNLIKSGEKFAARLLEDTSTFNIAGPAIFFEDLEMNKYVIGLLNSIIAEKIINFLNPTLSTNIGDIYAIPLRFSNDTNRNEIIDLVNQNIEYAKEEWDSFECSLNFLKHPLIKYKTNKVEQAWGRWKDKLTDRILKMKLNERHLDELFIKSYDLQNVFDNKRDYSTTLNEVSIEEAIKSLTMYFVGCLFGRFSIEKDGLSYTGGIWNISDYKEFIPDADNIIPITDEEYFSDDIVSRFVEFVRTVYGEDTLEENLDFIANALGNKGDTSREVIRNYFLKDFYADHLKVYQKRPIYWLFDSGKENGFKALIYMHRYDADTVGRVRTDYLHRTQKFVESAMQNAQYTIENTSSASEKSKATKAVTKYTKQLAEMKIYDEAIAHIANQRIEIDLDDGVKVNYEKFQGVEVAQEGKKTLKVDLLAKIK